MAKRKDSSSTSGTKTATLPPAATLPAAAAETEITLSEAPALVPTATDMIGPHRPVDATPEVAVETLTKIAAEIDAAPTARSHSSAAAPSASQSSTAQSATSRPFLRLAATVALAAALGAVLGAAGVSAIGHLTAEPAVPVVRTVEANPAKTAKLEGDIAALKTSLEAATKNTNGQFGKLAERLDRAEKAQAEPAAKLAKLSDKINDALERFDQRLVAASAPETTGSVSASRSAAPTEPKLQDKLEAATPATAPQTVVSGWVLRDIFDGRALVESRYGMYEVAPGGNLPGIGRVASIKRQDGRWVVVTPKGVIVSER